MKFQFTFGGVFLIVTALALLGMVMGGLFGWGAGYLAPGLFAHPVWWLKLEPIGVAIVVGGTAGVLCGGALGAFAVLVQLAAASLERRASNSRE